MRTLTRRAAALSIVATLALAGCGSSDSDDTPDTDSSTSTTDAPSDDETDDSDQADGNDVQGTGYSYSLPEGWAVPSASIPGTEQADTFAAAGDGTSTNVNVIRLDPAPLDDLDQLDDALKAELEGAGATDVTIGDRSEIDGDEAVHVTSTLTQQGKTFQAEQYNAIHGGVSYVVTFTFDEGVDEGDRDDLAASILDTWKWSV